MGKRGRCAIKGCKQRGEWAELCFMARAAARGMSVTRPHGDSSSYDVGVEHNGRYVRVQVKSTTFQRRGSYTCNIERDDVPEINWDQIDGEHIELAAGIVNAGLADD